MLRLAGFILLVSTVLFASVRYVVIRGLSMAGRLEDGEGKRRTRLWVGLTIGLFVFTLMPWLSRFHAVMHQPWSERLSAVGYMVGLAVVFSAALLIAVDLVGWILERARRRASSAATTPATETAPFNEVETPDEVVPALAEPAPTMPRRQFVTRAAYGAAIGVGAGHSAYAMLVGRHDYALEEITVRIRDLPPAFEGFTIAQISDVHLGTFVREPEIRAAIELLGRANADLITLTGDLMDHDRRLAPLLGQLTRGAVELRPRFGVVGIAGNHDYYTGIDTVLGTLREAGATVLRNSATELRDGTARLALLGTDDCWAERDNWGSRYDLDATLAASPRDCPRILLCHNPERFAEAAPHVDLQLSGHTHGGQINFGIRPADAFLRHGFVAGHYTRGEGQLYVNRGFGTVGPPARLYAAPEITRVTLIRA